MKEINVETYGVPAEGRSKNYRGKTVTASVSGGSASAASPQGGSASTANTANTANVALNLSSDSTDWEKILRKDEEDSTSYAIDFLKGLKIASVLISSVLASSSTGAASDDSIFTSKAVQAKIEDAIKALSDIYLSKKDDDSAKGAITFLKGLKLGSNFSIDELGNAILNSISLGTFEHLVKGLGLYKNSAGHWCIECDDAYFRMKAVFEQLEIRKMYSSAGNVNISPSGSKISRVEWLDASGNITTVAADTVAYKCYFLADDGTTATTNSWQAKDYALCKTFNIKEGVYANVSNQYYWRKVTDAGSILIEPLWN